MKKSLDEVYKLPKQHIDYWALSDLIAPLSTKTGDVAAILITTKPGLTVQNYSEISKLVEKVTGGSWRTLPFGTHRYAHVAFPVNDAGTNLDPDKVAADLVEAARPKTLDITLGQSSITSTELVKRTGASAAQLMTTHDTRDHIPAAIGESENAPRIVAEDVNENGKIFPKKQKAVFTVDTREPDWHLRFGRVYDAYQFLKMKQLVASYGDMGKGVTIGVIDTGYLPPHQELANGSGDNGEGVDVARGANFYAPFRKPEEAELEIEGPIDSFSTFGAPANPGHGTAVIGLLSIIPPRARTGELDDSLSSGMSPEELPKRLPQQSDKYVTAGLVPGAKVIPIPRQRRQLTLAPQFTDIFLD